MIKLKLGALSDDKTGKLTKEMRSALHRDLLACAEVLDRKAGQTLDDPAKLIGQMVERFMATDRGFATLRRLHKNAISPPKKSE